jgi:hypothetical protein
MDGRVLEEIFTPAYMAEHSVGTSEAVAYEAPEAAGAMTDEESEEIRQRLRGLGYLG